VNILTALILLIILILRFSIVAILPFEECGGWVEGGLAELVCLPV
jgi:hypothetical protein